jgi:hypothetical protein
MYLRTTTMGLSLPVTTMRPFHIISAEDTIKPKEMICINICRGRMRFRLSNIWANILVNAPSSLACGDASKSPRNFSLFFFVALTNFLSFFLFIF